MTTYKTGQRFKAKYKGEPIEGTLKQFESVPSYFSLLNNEGCHLASYCYGMSAKELEFFDITDLEIIHDQDEPVKGDLVECSDDNKTWKVTGEYIGLIRNDCYFVNLKEFTDLLHGWKHIRKAPTKAQKAQKDRQEAERKAREFCKERGHDTVPAILDALTEYILKSGI